MGRLYKWLRCALQRCKLFVEMTGSVKVYLARNALREAIGEGGTESEAVVRCTNWKEPIYRWVGKSGEE